MANVNIRINPEIKKKAEEVFKNLGLNPTSAITLFYIQAIRTNSIPFALIAEKPNAATLKAIEEAEEDMDGRLNKTREQIKISMKYR